MTEKQAPWVRFYPNTVREDLTASFPTMIAAWDHHVAERRDQPALHYFDATLTFGDVDDASDALGAAFQDMGVQRDDRIAVYLQNDPQWLVVMLAAWKVGAFPVAISPMLRHTELTHLLIDSGATVLVCLDHLYAEVAAEVVPQTPVRTVLTTHPLDLTPNVVLPERIAAQIAPPRTFGEALDWVATVRACGRKGWICAPPTSGSSPTPRERPAGPRVRSTSTRRWCTVRRCTPRGGTCVPATTWCLAAPLFSTSPASPRASGCASSPASPSSSCTGSTPRKPCVPFRTDEPPSRSRRAPPTSPLATTPP